MLNFGVDLVSKIVATRWNLTGSECGPTRTKRLSTPGINLSNWDMDTKNVLHFLRVFE